MSRYRAANTEQAVANLEKHMGRDYKEIVENKKRYPVVARPFHHDCNCLEGNQKKKKQNSALNSKKSSIDKDIKSNAKKPSENEVIEFGSQEMSLRVKTEQSDQKSKRQETLPSVDHIIVEEGETSDSQETDSAYAFKTELDSGEPTSSGKI